MHFNLSFIENQFSFYHCGRDSLGDIWVFLTINCMIVWQMMHAELQATCSALGYLDDGQYYKEPDCLGMWNSACN